VLTRLDMPKKTKREKILARARRIIQEQSSNRSNLPSVTTEQYPAAHVDNSYSFKPVSVPAVKYKQNDDDVREFAAIRTDLIKTMILSAAAVIIEIILYNRIFNK
jgi:hypothetical protein